MKRNLVLIASLLVFSLSSAGKTRDYTYSGSTVDGQAHVITMNNVVRVSKKLDRFVYKKNFDFINLSLKLNGGDMDAAMMLVQKIKKLREEAGVQINTRVTSSIGCHSACTVIFTAGEKRFASKTAKFGFHSPSTDVAKEKPLIPGYRKVWLQIVADVDPELAQILEEDQVLMDLKFVYYKGKDLLTGYVTDLI